MKPRFLACLATGIQICKTSTPGSNPGGASNFCEQIGTFGSRARRSASLILAYL
jgi:hypothetical protein